MSEADMPTQHRGPTEVHFARFQCNCLMKRQIGKSIVLAKEVTKKTASRGIRMVTPASLW
jgi:hypothetical protein